MSATEYLKLRLGELVNAEAIDAVAECVIAFEDKSKKRDLCAFLQDIFNIGKEKELEKIIDTYVSMLQGNSMALKNPSHTKSPKQQHKSVKSSKQGQSPSPSVAAPNSIVNSSNSKKPAVDAYVPFSPKVTSGKRTPLVSQCNCMATAHPFHASCYECGYILCVKNRELPACVFCKAIIALPATAKNIEDNEVRLVEDANVYYFKNSGSNAAMIKSYKQKDKLLQFDKENAKRTHVHDAQADYYESSTWLTAEEKRAIDEKEKKRRAAKNRLLSTRKINISFDIAGRKMVEYTDGAEEDEAAPVHPETVDSTINISSDSTLSSSISTLPSAVTLSVPSNAVSSSSSNTSSAGVATYDDNRELEYSAGRAGEVYRSMKKHWEEEDEAKLRSLLGDSGRSGNKSNSAGLNDRSGGQGKAKVDRVKANQKNKKEP